MKILTGSSQDLARSFNRILKDLARSWQDPFRILDDLARIFIKILQDPVRSFQILSGSCKILSGSFQILLGSLRILPGSFQNLSGSCKILSGVLPDIVRIYKDPVCVGILKDLFKILKGHVRISLIMTHVFIVVWWLTKKNFSADLRALLGT